MTTTMYWRPAPKETPPAHDLPDTLKRILARRYWDHDGSLYGGEVGLGTVADRTYLEGLRDAGVTGAAALLAAVIEHGAVELWIGE